MGGLCSRSSTSDHPSLYSNNNLNNYYQPSRASSKAQSKVTPPMVEKSMEKQEQEQKKTQEPVSYGEIAATGFGSNQDDFYDGIPRYSRVSSMKSRSIRSKQVAVAKVTEVGSRLGRAGTLGLGKAVEVLDTLGSSMTNLNSNSGFASAVPTKGNEITILAFEVANTIVKGSYLMQSLSKRSIRHLEEVVFLSEGVQNLITKDMDEFLRIAAADKREELKVLSGEVVRFGNRCKDSQWHGLDRYFEKRSGELNAQKQLKDAAELARRSGELNALKQKAELMMEHLMTLVQFTAELYHESPALDRFEQDYQRKRLEVNFSNAPQREDNLSIMRSELKTQRKQVKTLKKKSLWSRSLEEVMEKLVVIVLFLHMEIRSVLGSADKDEQLYGCQSNEQRLGPAGLSLHYANIVLQIDTIVARSSSMAPSSRDTLYQSLPPSMKSALRAKLESFHVNEELSVTEIKAEMEKTLKWLVPVAANTAKAHHGFGWVGEWANEGSDLNRKVAAGPINVMRIETLHHADKEKTEAYMLELVLWLHYLVIRAKSNANSISTRAPVRSPIRLRQPKHEAHNGSPLTLLTSEEREMLKDASKNKQKLRISKSQDFDSVKLRSRNLSLLTRSSSQSSTRESKELQFPFRRISSGIPVIDFGIDKEKALDVIDRVVMNMVR